MFTTVIRAMTKRAMTKRALVTQETNGGLALLSR